MILIIKKRFIAEKNTTPIYLAGTYIYMLYERKNVHI